MNKKWNYIFNNKKDWVSCELYKTQAECEIRRVNINMFFVSKKFTINEIPTTKKDYKIFVEKEYKKIIENPILNNELTWKKIPRF